MPAHGFMGLITHQTSPYIAATTFASFFYSTVIHFLNQESRIFGFNLKKDFRVDIPEHRGGRRGARI